MEERKQTPVQTPSQGPRKPACTFASPQLDTVMNYNERETSELLEAKWIDRLHDLLAYKRKYGDCNVPFQFKDNQRLANWVLKQRKFFRKGELPPHRAERLNAIGFEWTSYRRVTWEQRFEQLRAYRTLHGTAIVAEEHGDPQLVALAQWVKKQRTTQRKKEMGAERVAMLNSLGFVWDMEDTSWETRFSELVQFMVKNGNQANPKEAALKGWVYRQRSKFHEGILSEEKKRKLDAVGFNWGSAGRDSKEKQAAAQSANRLVNPLLQESRPQFAQHVNPHPLSSLVDACMMVAINKPPHATPRCMESTGSVATAVSAQHNPPRLHALPPRGCNEDGDSDDSSLNGRVVSVDGGMVDDSERTTYTVSTFASSVSAAAAPALLTPLPPCPLHKSAVM